MPVFTGMNNESVPLPTLSHFVQSIALDTTATVSLSNRLGSMDTLSFISSLVEHLATPVTALIALKILLKRAPQISQFVKSIRYKDIEINLRDEFEKAKEAAGSIELSSPEGAILNTARLGFQENDKILQLAEIDPGIAIAEIWKNIEGTIIKLMQHNGLMRFTRPEKLIEWLESKNKVSQTEVELFLRLRKIRNAAVHSGPSTPQISLAEVMEFKEFANVLIDRIEKIRMDPGYLDYPVPKHKLDKIE